MKVYFYINAIHEGGAERVIVNLAKYFAESNNDVAIITSFKDDWEYPVPNNVQRFVLEDKKSNCGFFKRNISRIKKLRRICKDEKPDVLVSFMAEPNFRAILATKGLKTKTIISIRNDPEKEYSSKPTKFLAKHLFKKANGIVFQTEEAKAWFPSKVQKKSQVIFNAVDEKFFINEIITERKDVVTCGRLTKQKNHKVLIDAFSLIADKISDNLLIYGEGELRDQLQQQIDNLGLCSRVKLMGQTYDVVNSIKSAKLFVLSSDYEGMPNALMEAMALGIPCISTDCPCGGPKMLFGNVENRILVPVNNSVTLSQVMLDYLEKSRKLYNLSNFLRERAKLFDATIINQKWLEFVSHVLKERN